MPQIDPTQYLFDALSSLTGGLINDIKTLFLGLVVCSFFFFAFDILISAMGAGIERRSKDRNFEKAQDLLDARNKTERGSASWDYYNLKYRNALRKSV